VGGGEDTRIKIPMDSAISAGGSHNSGVEPFNITPGTVQPGGLPIAGKSGPLDVGF
jgi:hypothetical protein